MTPFHKKGKKDKKDNYRLVRILSNLSKRFEKCMFNQMSAYEIFVWDEIFLKYQYGYRKGYSTQQCLLALLNNEKLQ